MDDDFGDGDIDSLALAIALQRAEIEDAEDREFDVLRSQLECIELAIQQEKDARMARSIAVANVADATAIEAVRCENEREFAAIEDDKDDEDLEIMQKQARPTTSDINTLSKLAGRYVSHETGRILLAQVGGGQEAWRHVEEVVDDPNSRKDCIICGEEKEFYDVVEAPCKDSYCQDCLQELFTKSFTDEGLFPPRCCRQPFVEEDIEIFLTREICDAFKEKEVEFKTTNRTYCYFQTCSAFIAPDKYNTAKGYARCPKCPRLTCVECKKRHHGKNDCPLDEDAQALLALAEQQGWQRCARCDFLVEHNTGCYHMTCRCKCMASSVFRFVANDLRRP